MGYESYERYEGMHIRLCISGCDGCVDIWIIRGFEYPGYEGSISGINIRATNTFFLVHCAYMNSIFKCAVLIKKKKEINE